MDSFVIICTIYILLPFTKLTEIEWPWWKAMFGSANAFSCGDSTCKILGISFSADFWLKRNSSEALEMVEIAVYLFSQGNLLLPTNFTFPDYWHNTPMYQTNWMTMMQSNFWVRKCLTVHVLTKTLISYVNVFEYPLFIIHILHFYIIIYMMKL